MWFGWRERKGIKGVLRLQYADVVYYRDVFGGEFEGEDEALERLLETASLHVDATALWKPRRLAESGRLSEGQRAALRRACCLQAEYIYERGAEPDGVRSVKVFDANVTYTDRARKAWFSTEAAGLLRGAGLVERAVG